MGEDGVGAINKMFIEKYSTRNGFLKIFSAVNNPYLAIQLPCMSDAT